MEIAKYLKLIFSEFLEFDNDYKSLLSNQDKIFEQLEKLEINNQQTNYSDYARSRGGAKTGPY